MATIRMSSTSTIYPTRPLPVHTHTTAFQSGERTTPSDAHLALPRYQQPPVQTFDFEDVDLTTPSQCYLATPDSWTAQDEAWMTAALKAHTEEQQVRRNQRISKWLCGPKGRMIFIFLAVGGGLAIAATIIHLAPHMRKALESSKVARSLITTSALSTPAKHLQTLVDHSSSTAVDGVATIGRSAWLSEFLSKKHNQYPLQQVIQHINGTTNATILYSNITASDILAKQKILPRSLPPIGNNSTNIASGTRVDISGQMSGWVAAICAVLFVLSALCVAKILGCSQKRRIREKEEKRKFVDLEHAYGRWYGN